MRCRNQVPQNIYMDIILLLSLLFSLIMPPQKTPRTRVPMSPSKKRTIKTLREEEWTMEQSAKKMGVNKSQISCTLKKLKKNPDFYARIEGPGRPSLVTDHDKCRLYWEIISGRSHNATEAFDVVE